MAIFNGLVAVLSLVFAVLSVVNEPEQPDSNLASQFLRDYFGTAPRDPSKTWSELTDGFVAERRARPDRPFTPATYAEYFHGFTEISVDHVQPSPKYPGWFNADVTYLKPGGKSSTSHQVFELECPDWTKYPLLSCTSSRIKINRAVIDTDAVAQDDASRTQPTHLQLDVTDAVPDDAGQVWTSQVRIENSGDAATHDCRVKPAAGPVRYFSLQPGTDRTIEVRLSGDATAGEVSIDVRCANVAGLPRRLSLPPRS